MGGVNTNFNGSIDVNGNLHAQDILDCGTVLQDAYFLSINSCTVNGIENLGVQPPPPVAMPISQAQIDLWKINAEVGGVLPGPYTVLTTETLGPIKIDGDLILSNNAILYLAGPIWVKGNITLGNNSKVIIDASLGNNGATLLADDPDNPATKGIITVSNNADILGNGNPNSFPLLLTTSTNTTGALLVQNNATSAIFYAPNGAINVANNAGGNQITGYKILLNNNAIINYVTGLQNAFFINGSGASWKFSPGSYVIMP